MSLPVCKGKNPTAMKRQRKMLHGSFKVGDLVWAKMKGFPPWPAIIENPPADSKKKKKHHYVFFFGSKNCAWIWDKFITPYSKKLLEIKRKSAAYQQAVEEFLSYLKPPNIEFTNKSSLKKSAELPRRSSTHSKIKTNSKKSQKKRVTFATSPEKLGFIGSPTIGKHIVRILLELGHKVSVWNKVSSQCDPLVDLGAERAGSPADLIVECDITYCWASDAAASNAILFGVRGILQGLDEAAALGLKNRGYVEMTPMDPDSSIGIGDTVALKRGRYLGVCLCRALSSKDAENGPLLILASGDRELFDKCQSLFHALGRKAYFVGDKYGDGARMSLIRCMLSGTVCAALAEVMALVDRLDLQKHHFLTCLEQGPLSSAHVLEKAQMMAAPTFQQVTTLGHIQREMNRSLLIGNECFQRTPVTAAANEVYKYGRLCNYSNEDMSAVYKVAKY